MRGARVANAVAFLLALATALWCAVWLISFGTWSYRMSVYDPSDRWSLQCGIREPLAYGGVPSIDLSQVPYRTTRIHVNAGMIRLERTSAELLRGFPLRREWQGFGVAYYHEVTGAGAWRITRHMVELPLLLICMACGALPAMLACGWMRRKVRDILRVRHGQCVTCGYRLHGISAAYCPECGPGEGPGAV
jgi:hypothetical protein